MTMRWLLWLTALALTAWFSLGGEDGAGEGVSEAVVRSAPAGAPTAEVSKTVRVVAKSSSPELGLHRLKLRESPQKSFDPETVADMAVKEPPIFHAQTWNPPPPKVVKKEEPPKPPPWPYTYLGQQLSGGVWWVYLTLGEETRAIKKDQVLDGKYRIDKIDPPQLSVTYLPLNEVQTVTIGALK
ncbi:hypothetical protein [Limnohabitans sp.]|uniref:hypothetical protein n=1 Tax=Limnohabitans sp. TaxID=1907725 RepID=UPI0038BDF36E